MTETTRPLAGKVALVTGASRGIGRAIAERLARDGAAVALNYFQGCDQVEQAVAAITGTGGDAVAVQADVRQVSQVRWLVQQAAQWRGRLDILVNNAGGGIATPLTEVTEVEFDDRFALNAKGAFFAMQEALRHLGPGGRIINISATVTQMRVGGATVYAGAKAALEQFTRHSAKELGPRGITVNTVSPGGVDTAVFRAHAPAEQHQAAQGSPLGRIGEPRDIADIVAFLASEQARWLTGQIIHADGGAL